MDLGCIIKGSKQSVDLEYFGGGGADKTELMTGYEYEKRNMKDFWFQKLQMIGSYSKMGQFWGGGRAVGIVLFCPC